MAESRIVQTTLDNILSLVSCAETYGYNRQVFYHAMAGIVGHVTDEEIEAFASGFLTGPSRSMGYTEEDYDAAKRSLTEWRDKYMSEG